MSRFSGKMDESGPKETRKNKGVMKAYRIEKIREAYERGIELWKLEYERAKLAYSSQTIELVPVVITAGRNGCVRFNEWWEVQHPFHYLPKRIRPEKFTFNVEDFPRFETLEWQL